MAGRSGWGMAGWPTVVISRNRGSGDAFRFKKEQGVGFIPYHKGRKARRRYPQKLFQPSWFFFENQRHTYRVFEKQTRVTKAGAIRTVVFLGEEKQQIAVLTNLDP